MKEMGEAGSYQVTPLWRPAVILLLFVQSAVPCRDGRAWFPRSYTRDFSSYRLLFLT
jgi:hypothetical protein